MEQRLRGGAFAVLKKALKARGMTYEDLAGRLGVSTPTIKRLFVDRDCKLARLLEICDVLGVSAGALFESAARVDGESATLSPQVERALADSPSLFHVYILLREPFTPEQIARSLGLSVEDVFLYVRDLERLGLAVFGASGAVQAKPEGPVAFAKGGPLRRQIKRINTEFLDRAFDAAQGPQERGGPASFFATRSRRMSAEAAEEIRRDLEAVMRKAAVLAQQDQLLYGADSLQTMKLVALWAPAEFETLLQVEPHPRRAALATTDSA